MKSLLKITFILSAILLTYCKQKNTDIPAGEPVQSGGNELLEAEVNRVHDEVMPKMNDIYLWKDKLKKKMETQPDMAEEEKQKLSQAISKLDSAWDGMMIWMRQYKPPGDSVGEQKAREYLENEMEKVKKVKQDINESLDYAELVHQ